MFNKKLAIILLFTMFLSKLLAHEVAKFDIQIKNLQNNYSTILVKSLQNKKSIWGNQVKIISNTNNRTIDEFILSKDSKYETPKEEYHVVIKVGNHLFFKNSIEKNKNKIFYVLLGICFILLLILIIIIFKINRSTK